MTNRERLLAALHRKEVDRLPWAPLIDGYFLSSLHLRGYSDHYIETMRMIDCDILERHVHAASEIYRDVQVDVRQNGNLVNTIIQTPIGRLTQEKTISGNTEIVTKYFVDSLESIKLFEYLADHTDFRPEPKAFAQRDQELGDLGLPSLTGPMSPIQELLQLVCGVENTVYFLLDYEDEMQSLMEAMHRRNLRKYKALLEAPAALLIAYEDTSTTVMNRDMMHKLSVPYLEEYAKVTRDAGKIFIAHMCGKLTGFKDIINDLDVDGIDSVCPPSTGDLCLWDARATWGSQKLLIGGIDPPSLFFNTPDKVIGGVAEILMYMKDKTGVILCTGDATPYGTPLENLRIISRFVQHLGKTALQSEIDPDEMAQNVQQVMRES